jgi:hypothetical protein
MLFSQTLSKKETYYSTYLDTEIVDLLGCTYTIPDSYQAQVAPCERDYIARPDLVGDLLYNDDMYGDLVVKLNGPGDPFALAEEQNIIIPALDVLENFYQTPAKAWSEQYISKQASRPTAKARNEKRKPNEAVIGDKRFNIDSQSKVIIY